ncbi:MAG: polysaccharide biosynthesis protein [Phycisphaerales bacterium]|nr:polysaccharide biosynthesis protein [Phycisphaerales bacterium]
MLSWVDRIPRRGKQLAAVAVDALTLGFATWMVLAARLEVWWPTFDTISILALAGIAVAVGLPVCWGVGLYREITRYIGLRFALRVACTVGVTALGTTAILVMVERQSGVPRSAPLMFVMAAFIGIVGTRLAARQIVRRVHGGRQNRTIIFGAGDVGAGLVSLLAHDQRSEVVGFIDDDPARVGSFVRSVPVFGTDDIRGVVRRLRADTVLLALPESHRSRRRELFQSLSVLGIRVMLVPTLQEIADGTSKVDSIRSMKIEDLLGRAPVEPKSALLTRNIAGENVLITGAGGSIGSELARQVLALGPRKLVLLDQSEFGLYSVETELRRKATSTPSAQIVSVLASVLDEVRMERVLTEHAIGTLFHAAAYKHVPIVEANEIEGISVNVMGTLRTAMAAQRAFVRSLVLVSTDKAVRPTSVMGASKRLAEKCLQALSAAAKPAVHHGSHRVPTKFTMVRFGNVLDSSGSVVPLFADQIRRGGPITLTDLRITRYFMTIPEASSLVIQAGAMGKGGDVFVLEMGEPVKIFDLATHMIRLAGYQLKDADHPHGDIEVVVTGLRPGEKLYEELLIGNDCAATEHPAIMRAEEPFIPWQTLEPMLERLQACLDQHDVPAARDLLAQLVSGYTAELAK